MYIRRRGCLSYFMLGCWCTRRCTVSNHSCLEGSSACWTSSNLGWSCVSFLFVCFSYISELEVPLPLTSVFPPTLYTKPWRVVR